MAIFLDFVVVNTLQVVVANTLEVVVPGGGGGYSDIFIHTFGFKTLNFIILGFQKKLTFLGV